MFSVILFKFMYLLCDLGKSIFSFFVMCVDLCLCVDVKFFNGGGNGNGVVLFVVVVSRRFVVVNIFVAGVIWSDFVDFVIVWLFIIVLLFVFLCVIVFVC